MNNQWWQQEVVYQIYPRSFQDSKGDGIGDIPGIIRRLDYLKDLGVGILWLNPIYQSPNDDNGYDISDYRAIMDVFGDMDDFDRLLDEVHKRQMRLIMDLVVNHTSDEHEWFQQSKRPETNNWSDFYIWRAGEGDQPPNNWQSFFEGPAWEYSSSREMYYLHLFTRKQPDLNWENPQVRQEVLEIIRFWLEKGIDGFRMDVINLISKQDGLPDGDDQPGLTGQEHFANGPRIKEYLGLIRDAMEGYDLMTIGETVMVDVETVAEYVNPEDGFFNLAISFEHVSLDRGEGPLDPIPFDPYALKTNLSDWQRKLAGRGWNCLYLTNHDQPRQVSRFGDGGHFWNESAKMLATLLHTLQGTPFIMQGEEIGMTNVAFKTIEDYRDVATHNYYKDRLADGENPDQILQRINECSRDNSRTPMQWDATPNAGFTAGKPWIGVNPNYAKINAADQINDPNSVYSYYKELIGLRKEYPILALGEFVAYDEENPSAFVYQRKYQGSSLTVALNLTGEQVTANLPASAAGSAVLISNYENPPLPSQEIKLRPFEAITWLKQ
jgi:oligo-1,6-glucosidase